MGRHRQAAAEFSDDHTELPDRDTQAFPLFQADTGPFYCTASPMVQVFCGYVPHRIDAHKRVPTDQFDWLAEPTHTAVQIHASLIPHRIPTPEPPQLA